MDINNLPQFYNLPIDASIAEFANKYEDIICLNVNNQFPDSTFKLFDIVENISSQHPEFNVKLNIEVQEPVQEKSEAVKTYEQYLKLLNDPQAVTSEVLKDLDSTNNQETPIENPSENRSVYEMYEKMFAEGTFGQETTPEAKTETPAIENIDSSKAETLVTEEKSENRSVYEMYEKMFAEGTFGQEITPEAKTETPAIENIESTKVETPITEEKSENRSVYEMYEKMFADGTFGQEITPEAKTETPAIENIESPKAETPVSEEKSENRSVYEMYEKMFADGTFGQEITPEAKTETPAIENIDSSKVETPITEEKSENRSVYEMYEKMFAEGTFGQETTPEAKTETPAIENIDSSKAETLVTEEKSENRSVYEMYEKMFADGTFEEQAKAETPAIENLNIDTPISENLATESPKAETLVIDEKSENRSVYEMYEKMFADGTLEIDPVVENKTETPLVTTSTQTFVETPNTEKSEARSVYEMYEKMFAEGTFGQEATPAFKPITNFPDIPEVEETPLVDEKSEARSVYEMYEKMFNDGTFEQEVKQQKHVLSDITTKEMSDKIFANDTFARIEPPLQVTENKTEETIVALEKLDTPIQPEIPSTTQTANSLESFENIKDLQIQTKTTNDIFYLRLNLNGEFLEEFKSEEPTDQSLYKFRLLTEDTAQFELIENSLNHKVFSNLSEYYFLPFCDILNSRHESHKIVKSLRTGKVVKENNKWIVKEKTKVMYQ